MVKKIRYENLCKKYGVTIEELNDAIQQINLGQIACSGTVLVALCDLLASGDIKSE
jgi:hypothetical protein